MEVTTQDDIIKVYEGLKILQLEKNKRYGDSALHPIHVFSRGTADELLKARLDDKLSRVANGGYYKNDLADLIGYLVLLLINEEWTEFGDLID